MQHETAFSPRPIPTRPIPTYDLCLLLRRFRRRWPVHERLGLALSARLGATAVVGADAYYHPHTDIAVLLLRLDVTIVTGPAVAAVRAETERTGDRTLEVAKLTADQRHRLRARLLTSAGAQAVDAPGPEQALDRLIGSLALRRLRRRPTTGTPPPVRFRRGDTWQPGRLSRIDQDGVFIATGGPPRPGDRITVEIRSRRGPILAPAVTVQVTSPTAAAAAGATGFSARFAFPDPLSHRAVATAIAAARDAVVAAPEPPRRRETRYPLRWPAFLLLDTARPRIDLLDVSRRGLFAATEGRAVAGCLDLEVPSDDRRAPLHLRARVARKLRGDDGVRHHLAGDGIGLELAALPCDVEERYAAFVERVARRGGRRILVGAGPTRARALLGEFLAAGYIAEGATSEKELRARALGHRAAPDAVVLDPSLAGSARVRRLARALERHLGATVLTDGESPDETRRLIDAALV